MPVQRTARLLVLLLLGLLPVGLVAAGPAAARPIPGAGSSSSVAGSVDAVLAAAAGPRPPREAPARGVWPLRPAPEVVHTFDPPRLRWGAGHRGVDLAGAPGQRVRSALGGRVSFAGRIAGRGVVVVDHGSARTTYEPVVALVARGERVTAGQVIGALTTSGSHCWPRACLHWGLRRGETYLDPLTLVDAPQPVRLLPW